jgi:hypothetical protein
MNVDIGAEAALFPEKEYINGIAVAVQSTVNLVPRYELVSIQHFSLALFWREQTCKKKDKMCQYLPNQA